MLLSPLVILLTNTSKVTHFFYDNNKDLRTLLADAKLLHTSCYLYVMAAEQTKFLPQDRRTGRVIE